MIHAAVTLRRRDFTLDVDIHEDAPIAGLFGPSGAGKTTLLSIIAGLQRPDAGRVVLNGQTLFDSERRIDLPPHHRRIGLVFQEHRLFPHYSVRGNMLYARRATDNDLRRIADLLELEPLLDRRVATLSGGERQRVALGRALLSSPRILLLDEPLASLDLRLRQQIITHLRRVRDELNIPTLHVSHDLTEILQLTDRLLVLDRGSLVAAGPYSSLVHRPDVLPLVHDRGMQNVIHARVHEHLPDDGLSVLALGAGDIASRLAAPLTTAPAGATVTISLRPWDVALAAAPAQHVSIQNQVRATVTRCTSHERSMIVEVDIGVPLLTEISRRAAAALDVREGAAVVCLIKSHAIRYLDPP